MFMCARRESNSHESCDSPAPQAGAYAIPPRAHHPPALKHLLQSFPFVALYIRHLLHSATLHNLTCDRQRDPQSLAESHDDLADAQAKDQVGAGVLHVLLASELLPEIAG